ncbi:relaxase/mobilization nuclease domain-containing protein [Nocardia xishanensis]
MPNISKGADMVGLVRYLAGPGKHNEHTNQRVIAGDIVSVSVFGGRIDVERGAELGRLLDSSRQTVLKGAPVLVTSYKKAKALMAEGMSKAEAFDAATSDEHVWHCSLALAASEGELTDEKWAAISRDFLIEMGFVGREDVPDVRWAAIRHGLSKAGNDHVHLALSVVRPDGSLIDTYRDLNRSQAAANMLEHKHGLRVLWSREEGGTERGVKPGEQFRAAGRGAPATDRELLHRQVRAVAAAADTEAKFVGGLREAGIMVRPRFAEGGHEVTGYSVRFPPHRAQDSGVEATSLWYGGGRLSKDLTLSALRAWTGWEATPQSQDAAMAQWRGAMTTKSGRSFAPDPVSEREAITRLGQWSAYMRTIPVTDRDAWAKAAGQTSGLFAAASMRTETRPGPLNQLSRQLARAAQTPAHQRHPRSPHKSGMRAVSRMLWSTTSKAASNIVLIEAMIDCLLTVMDMLAATERANAAAAMAAHARQALTDIHLRAAGVDPSREYVRAVGSPGWAAHARAKVVTDRPADQAHQVEEIETVAGQWGQRRIALQTRPGAPEIDEFGHIIEPGEPTVPEATVSAGGEAQAPEEKVSPLQRWAAKAAAEQSELYARLGKYQPDPAEPRENDDIDDATDALDRGRESATEQDWQTFMPPPGRRPDRGTGFEH